MLVPETKEHPARRGKRSRASQHRLERLRRIDRPRIDAEARAL